MCKCPIKNLCKMRKIGSLKLQLFLYCYSCEIFHIKVLVKEHQGFDSQEYHTLKEMGKKNTIKSCSNRKFIIARRQATC